MSTEQTYIMVKVRNTPLGCCRHAVHALLILVICRCTITQPDGVQRGLVGDIISRFEKRGYKVRERLRTELEQTLETIR